MRALWIAILLCSSSVSAASDCDLKLIGSLSGLIEIAIREKVRTAKQIQDWLNLPAPQAIVIRQTLNPAQLPVAKALVQKTGEIPLEQWKEVKSKVGALLKSAQTEKAIQETSRQDTRQIFRPRSIKKFTAPDDNSGFAEVAWAVDELGWPVLAIAHKGRKITAHTFEPEATWDYPTATEKKMDQFQSASLAWIRNSDGTLDLAGNLGGSRNAKVARAPFPEKELKSIVPISIEGRDLKRLTAVGQDLFALEARIEGGRTVQKIQPVKDHVRRADELYLRDFRTEQLVMRTRDGRTLAPGFQIDSQGQTNLIVAEYTEKSGWTEIYADRGLKDYKSFSYVSLFETRTGELILLSLTESGLELRHPLKPGSTATPVDLGFMFSVTAIPHIETDDGHVWAVVSGSSTESRLIRQTKVVDLRSPDHALWTLEKNREEFLNDIFWIKDPSGAIYVVGTSRDVLEIYDPFGGSQKPLARYPLPFCNHVSYLQLEDQVYMTCENRKSIEVFTLFGEVKR